jgi:transcriptional regulator with XRE-family HTH domain
LGSIGRMSHDVQKLVGRNVARLRKAADITQAELAARMDVDRAYISGLERGERNPTISSVARVSAALGTKISTLFEEAAKRTKSGQD